IIGQHDIMGRHKACPYDVIIVDDQGIVAHQGLAAFPQSTIQPINYSTVFLYVLLGKLSFGLVTHND
ncbi:MAG: hypothetical protein V3T91_03870, partial [Candidatus Bipolaricaulota bacterium]